MNMQNQEDQNQYQVVVDVLCSERIAAAMVRPEFTPAHLPGLWQQIEDHQTERWPHRREHAWNNGVGAMFWRCDTFPQFAELAAALFGLPSESWGMPAGWLPRFEDLLCQATEEELLQAFEYEKQHPGYENLVAGSWRWRLLSSLIGRCAAVEQLTGPIIEQLLWNEVWLTTDMHATADRPEVRRRKQHIVDHIQQHLLAGDTDAWVAFLENVDRETRIGATAARVAAA